MPPESRWRDVSTLRDYVYVVRRHKWLILAIALLVPAAAVGLSLLQGPRYEASAQVLLSRQNVAAALTGTPDPNALQDPARFGQTQADLARVPTVAERTVKAAGLPGRPPRALLEASEVEAEANADLLEFRVQDERPARAVRLATEYARQFTIYRSELDTAGIERAREEVEQSLRELDRAGDSESALYQSLVDKEQQLRTIEALQTSNAFLVRSADRAEKVQPQPVRNGILGFVLGLFLGTVVAFLRHALDTRVRSAEEVGEELGLPLLARIPEPPRRVRSKDRLVMLAEPSAPEAEAFRMLRTNLDFVTLGREAKVIMVTSAVEREGKSTTVANLAVAMARGGRRVVLVDLDLRRPYLDRFFKLQGRPGLTNVALGRSTLREVVTDVALAKLDRRPAAAGNGRQGVVGMLQVLPSGPIPPDAGEFVNTEALSAILEELRAHAELVLVDAPPLLHVGDAMALSAKVDGLVLVTRLDVVRRPMLKELHRLIETSPAAKLGYVVTGVDAEESYASGYGAYYRPETRLEEERVG